MENSTFSKDSETSFTFKVDPVELCKEFPNMSTVESIIRRNILTKVDKTSRWGGLIDFKGEFEDCSHRKDMKAYCLGGNLPGMIAALHTAYQDHYALSLSVSDFIILIGQGFGAHINKNTQKLRKYFVDHEGKEKIIVERHDFVLGEPNDWSTSFGEFAEEIKKRVKADVFGVIIDDTSVATATTRIVSEITLMDAVKEYFSYAVDTFCGIPEITLEGRPEDWQKLKEKVRKLVEMNKDDCLDLKWWLDVLVPVVDKICEAGIERKVDVEFWSSIYKYHDGSGGPGIKGWIVKFFPYVFSDYGGEERNDFYQIKTDNTPKQVCQVPFVWNYHGFEFPMKFTAGFLGAEYNEGKLKPAHFWCVTQDENSKE